MGSEFEVSLIYKASPGQPELCYREPCLKQNKTSQGLCHFRLESCAQARKLVWILRSAQFCTSWGFTTALQFPSFSLTLPCTGPGFPASQRSVAMCCEPLMSLLSGHPRKAQSPLPTESSIPVVVVHACNPSPQDAGAGRSMQAGGQGSEALFEQKLLNIYIKSRILLALFPVLWMIFAFFLFS